MNTLHYNKPFQLNRFIHSLPGLLKTTAVFAITLLLLAEKLPADENRWKTEWPRTDFSRFSVDFSEIISGGPPKDGIMAIDNPRFILASRADLGNMEPVISVSFEGHEKSYPIRVLIFHEIVNDVIGNKPIIVTYCPLCNSSVVFNRHDSEGKILSFGVTGKLRHSDLIMYDRQTESWWQQFSGDSIVGKYTGTKLESIPARIESFEQFRERAPMGLVLEKPANSRRNYGTNPYVGYEKSKWPFLYRGEYEGPVPAMSYVVSVGKNAWPLKLLREKKEIRYEGIRLRWEPGQNSPLDHREIIGGRDIGNVTVTINGKLAIYNIPFAFAFYALQPGGIIHTETAG